MLAWSDIRATWDRAFQQAEAAAVAAWQDAIQTTPERFRGAVERFVGVLAETRQSLDDLRALATRPGAPAEAVARYLALNARFNAVAAGLMADAVSAEPPQLGAASVLVVGGLAIGVVGVAWAVAAWEYAAGLRDEVQLAREELAARLSAAQQGHELPPSTLPDRPAARPVWPWLLGLGLLAGLGGLGAHHLYEKGVFDG